MARINESSRSDVEAAVSERYSAAAQTLEPALCCPVEYSSDLLSVIPDEILAKDYGCGDPTRYVHKGDTVVDLGSGAGKLCYMLAQAVGREGRVIGVDCNLEMLSLARKYQAEVAERLGYSNVDFRYGMIQDLRLDLEQLAQELGDNPVRNAADWLAMRSAEERLRSERPLIDSDSVDCVVSNCVLNLVRQQDRCQLFSEIFRVLRAGGRAAISDIVSDEDVPESLQRDPTLWSGCISGAFREDRFLAAFEEAGFHGVQVVGRQREPWQTVEGIEFRSLTVVAYKDEQGPSLERNQAVVYRGPFKKVEDDDGQVYARGERMAVCDKTFQRLQRDPYTGMFDAIEPRTTIPIDAAKEFESRRGVRRHPRETKGKSYRLSIASEGPCCGSDDGSCC